MTVHVIAAGGTISSHFDGTTWTNLTGVELVDEIDGDLVAAVGGVVVHEVAAGPSSHLGVDDMVRIAHEVQRSLHDGATGVVVMHGTDTLELTAFVTQLLLGTSTDRRPVVFTGSMRVHSHPGADGPANLRNSLALAAHPAAIGRDVMVCLDGLVHAADRVTKVSAVSLDAFTSAPLSVIGSVDVDAVTMQPASDRRRRPALGLTGDIPMIVCHPGVEPSVVETLIAGRTGCVIEVFGDLNVPRQLWRPIHDAAARGVLVVLTSPAFTTTVRNDDLDRLGAIGAGGLTTQKARLAVDAALASTSSREDASDFLAQYAVSFDAGDRSSS